MRSKTSSAFVASAALAVLGLLSFSLAAAPTQADVLLQTATLGPSSTAGYTLDSSQYFGAKFQISQAFTLTNVQLNAFGTNPVVGNGLIFAAIVPLSSLSALPTAGNIALIADDNPVEFHTFSVSGINSSLVTVPFTTTLSAGAYAVVFGSGEFGATGAAAATSNNPNLNNPQYLVKLGSSGFFNGVFSNAYFAVNGTPVNAVPSAAPEPGSLALLLPVMGTVGIVIRLRKK